MLSRDVAGQKQEAESRAATFLWLGIGGAECTAGRAQVRQSEIGTHSNMAGSASRLGGNAGTLNFWFKG